MKPAVQRARTELRNDLIEAGFRELADIVADGASPATHFDFQPAPDEDIPIGASKLGGRPDLPADFTWPRRRRIEREFELGVPLQLQRIVDHGPSSEFSLPFVCQLNLEDVHTDVLGKLSLPAHGLLAFFYDAEQQPWGFDPIIARGGWLVIWMDLRKQRLIRTALPEVDGVTFASARLLPRLLLTVPEHLIHSVHIEQERRGRTCSLFDILGAWRTAGVQVGGDPVVIQNPMEEQCEYASRGYYSYDEAKDACPDIDPAQWRLLLQLSSVEALGMVWGSFGNLYVWARQADIESRRFENAWTLLQCT